MTATKFLVTIEDRVGLEKNEYTIYAYNPEDAVRRAFVHRYNLDYVKQQSVPVKPWLFPGEYKISIPGIKTIKATVRFLPYDERRPDSVFPGWSEE